MTDDQKKIIRELLRLAYSSGFDTFYPLKPIADSMGIKDTDIYDPDTEKGILEEYGESGNGFINFRQGQNGIFAVPNFDTRTILENWTLHL